MYASRNNLGVAWKISFKSVDSGGTRQANIGLSVPIVGFASLCCPRYYSRSEQPVSLFLLPIDAAFFIPKPVEFFSQV